MSEIIEIIKGWSDAGQGAFFVFLVIIAVISVASLGGFILDLLRIFRVRGDMAAASKKPDPAVGVEMEVEVRNHKRPATPPPPPPPPPVN